MTITETTSGDATTPKKNAAERRPQLRGEQRRDAQGAVRAGYENGMSIRNLAEQHGFSYGLTHTLLVESGATLRSKAGGRARKPK